MKFQIKDKRVILIDRTMRLVGDNEYEFLFEFDEEWEGKTKTARFVMGDYMKDIVLNNDKCLVEKTFFKGGQLKVGVYASNLATEVLERKVKSSILEEDGGEPTVPENLWTQLLEIINADVQYVRDAVSDAEQSKLYAQEAVNGFGDVVRTKTEEFNTNAANKIKEYDEHTSEYAAEINLLKDDLAEVETEIGVYKPLKKRGTTIASGNVKIIENVGLKKGVTYTMTCNLVNGVDSSTYIGLWEDSISTSYLSVMTINPNTIDPSSRSFKWIYDDTENAYFTISSAGRTVNWVFNLTDNADHSSRIDKLEDGITTFDDRLEHLEIPTYQKFTEDISHTIKYTDRADDYADSEKISIVYGDKVKTYNPNTPYRQIKVYYGENLVRTIDNVFEYTVVDTSVTHLILTVYKNQKDIDDTVIVTRTKLAPKKEDKSDYAIRKPRVTFIDDDGNVEFYTHILPIMKIQGVPMVSAYMGDSNTDMHSNSAMMNLEQCKAVVDAGGEIIVHYNPDLRTLSLDEAERIVLKSKNVLKKYGFNSDLVAYSNGTCSPEIRAMIAKHFKAGFTGAYPRVSDTDRSNHDCIPQYFIHREPCGGLYYDTSETSRSYDYFKNMVDECVANNGWLVFTLHSWLMPEGQTKPEYGNTNQLELLGQIISYIKSLEATTSIKIVTASEGLEMFGNVMQTGDYMGYWNEMTLTAEESTMMGGHNASDAGCAMNKSGQWDFPTSKKITH